MSRSSHRAGSASGFTLVELLVVIGIISVLIAILLPALNKARQAAITSQCMSNMRQICVAQSMYASYYNGWVNATGETYYQVPPRGTAGWKFYPNWSEFLYRPKSYADEAEQYGVTGRYGGWCPSMTFISSTKVFQCPGDNSFKANTVAYGHNWKLVNEGPSAYLARTTQAGGAGGVYIRLTKIKHPAEFFWLSDTDNTSFAPHAWTRFRHPYPKQNLGDPGVGINNGQRANMAYADGHVRNISWQEFREGISPWGLPWLNK